MYILEKNMKNQNNDYEDKYNQNIFLSLVFYVYT